MRLTDQGFFLNDGCFLGTARVQRVANSAPSADTRLGTLDYVLAHRFAKDGTTLHREENVRGVDLVRRLVRRWSFPQRSRDKNRSYVVVPEKLSESLFLQSAIDGIDGILCKEVMDDRPKPCNFGLGMEAL